MWSRIDLLVKLMSGRMSKENSDWERYFPRESSKGIILSEVGGMYESVAWRVWYPEAGDGISQRCGRPLWAPRDCE